MKKHLWGFALFNLIVGTAMIVAILTGNFPRPANRHVYEVSRTSCRMNVRQNYESQRTYENSQDSIKVTQVVLDERTNKLNMSFSIQRETPSTQGMTVKLTFINAALKVNESFDGEVRTEFITLLPNFNVNNQAVYSMPLDSIRLNEFGKKDNLYIKAEIYNGSSTDFKTVGRSSDFTEFTPILLIDKK